MHLLLTPALRHHNVTIVSTTTNTNIKVRWNWGVTGVIHAGFCCFRKGFHISDSSSELSPSPPKGIAPVPIPTILYLWEKKVGQTQRAAGEWEPVHKRSFDDGPGSAMLNRERNTQMEQNKICRNLREGIGYPSQHQHHITIISIIKSTEQFLKQTKEQNETTTNKTTTTHNTKATALNAVSNSAQCAKSLELMKEDPNLQMGNSFSYSSTWISTPLHHEVCCYSAATHRHCYMQSLWTQTLISKP